MRRITSNLLRDLGVGPDMPTLAEIMEDLPKKVYIAVCDSIFCTRKFRSRKVIKPLAKWGSNVCEDCGHALFWKLEKKKG